MSAKENPHKLKHERRRRRRSSRSCLSCCFSASPAVYESGDLESTLASWPESKDQKTSWFSWRKKKKTVMAVPVPADVSMKSIPAGQGDHKDKLHKTKSNKPKRSDSQVQHQEEPLKLNTNSASRSTSLPKISTKYGARSQAAVAPPSSTTDPVRTRTRTKHHGSSESSQSPVHGENSDRPATLDPVFGLLVLCFTLAIMLTCGRTCAIACLCASFYLVPLLRTTTEVTEGGSRERKNSSPKVDVESEEYKKRVVMEGLLERNGRRLSGLSSGKAPAATEVQQFC